MTNPAVPTTPAEQVLTQLARQKWAVDDRDADALYPLYTADSAQVIYQQGPDGRKEIARQRGREEVIANMTAGWARSAATWYPGSMIHSLGSCLAEPAGEGRFRCRSYATILAIDPSGVPVLKGYCGYDDIWALDNGEWRLAYRETVLYGYGYTPPHLTRASGR
jgi:hypothetical protein